jgi:MoaA/NifB/PqqE/SkfB family radical SAM enzyme
MGSNMAENSALSDREIEKRSRTVASKPRRIIVTLSTKCNSACIMCEVRHGSWDIPAKTLREIVEMLPYLEVISWQGGEVFYLDFFRELFDESLRHDGLLQTIVSNGLLIDEKIVEKLTGTRTNIELAISVDGTTEEVYEKIRKGSCFRVLLRNLRMLQEARAKNNAQANLRLRLHTVVMRSNYEQMETFIEFARTYGFTAFHMMPIWGNRAPGEDIFAQRDPTIERQVREKLAVISRKAKEYGIELLNSLPVKEEQEKPEQKIAPCCGEDKNALLCHLPWKQMVVDPGGGVRPGCLCPQTIGSVEQSSLLELWNGERMQKYREAVLRRDGGWCSSRCISESIPKELRGF